VHGSALATFVYILPLNSSLYGTAPLASCATIVCFDFGGTAFVIRDSAKSKNFGKVRMTLLRNIGQLQKYKKRSKKKFNNDIYDIISKKK
jgi:hypothetical protein